MAGTGPLLHYELQIPLVYQQIRSPNIGASPVALKGDESSSGWAERDEGSRWQMLKQNSGSDTSLKTNISPENRPLEKEIPIGFHHFQGLC